MNKWQPLIRIAFMVLMIWGLLRLISRFLGSFAILLLVIVALVFAVTIWMLHYDRNRLAKVYTNPAGKYVIDLVCNVTKTQAPVEHVKSGQVADKTSERPSSPSTEKEKKHVDQLLPKTPQDFQRFVKRLQSIVRGHNHAIEKIVDNLHGAILLRNKADDSVQKPLLIQMLVGEEGIGKKYLATKLARLLYKKPGITVLNMSDCSDASAVAALFGSESKEGVLVSAVKKQPFNIIVLENIERAHDRVLDRLRKIFQSGVYTDPVSKSKVSFPHCVFILTTTRATEDLRRAASSMSGGRSWSRKATEIFSTETGVDPNFLECVEAIQPLLPLTSNTRAEILCLLIEKQCKKFQVALQWIDPEVLAEEVSAMPVNSGMATGPSRVDRLLRDPLVRAAKSGAKAIELRQNQITMVGIQEDNIL